MSDLINIFFGPLTKNSCFYFLFVTILFFIFLIFFLFAELFYIIKNYKNFNFRMLTNTLLLLSNLFLGYFVNRLLYTMCSKSLH
jgi:hypothetical protein